ncbi:E4 protein [Barthadenovirus mellis]|uniref:E4 protein n=1 Tax=Passerine adenovirus 1 TaxID=2779174 RepID=A0A7L9DJC2_9ADEN|nr:E4 protein [Passerine adenovirus 1]
MSGTGHFGWCLKGCHSGDARRLFCFGTGFVSKDSILEAVARNRAGYAYRLLLCYLCDLPGCDGVLHLHCTDKDSLQFTALRVLLEPIVREIVRGTEGVQLTYYGTHWLTGFAVGRRVWVKCSTADYMNLTVLMHDVARLKRVHETHMGWVLEMVCCSDNPVKEMMCVFKSFVSQYDLGTANSALSGGVVNFTNSCRLSYGINLSLLF